MSRTTRLVQIVLRPQNTQVFSSLKSEACEQTNSVLRQISSSTYMSPQFYMRILSSFMANVNIIANNKKQNFLRLLCSIIWIVPLWSKSLDFTSFGENAITSIFVKRWDSLGFLKKMVRKNANIGQKMNSLLLAKMPSLRFSPRDGIL